ncbi:MAG: hypothetical protein AB7S81_00485 [Bdellovibrionales bacterium]
MLSKIVWFTKFRHKGKSNALGLIAGATVYFAGHSLNVHHGLDPLAYETFLGGLALLVAVSVTALFRVLVKRFPFLQKIEGSAEELLDKVPDIETPTEDNPSLSKGPENGNYNK